MYQRAPQFFWMCGPLRDNMVYEEISHILLYSESRTALLAINFRRVKAIEAYSASSDRYLGTHGM